MSWRLKIEIHETDLLVVVRAVTEAGQVFVELVKPASEREMAVAKMRDYCAAQGWTATVPLPLPRSRPQENDEDRAGRERADEDRFDYLKDEGLLRRR